MKKKFLVPLICGLFLAACSTQATKEAEQAVVEEYSVTLAEKTSEANKNFSYYAFNAEEAGLKSERSNVLTPTFYIFAGEKSLDETNKLVSEIQFGDVVEEWASNVYVIPPMDGNSYTQDDATEFLELVAQAPVTNVKVIGLDEGADFVNSRIAPNYGYLLAGVLTVNGDVDAGISLPSQVPAYISQSSKEVVELYAQNDKEKAGAYQDDKEDLQKVVVSEEKLKIADVFDDAWEKILSKNYRMHNDMTEFYTANPKEITSGYGLEPVVNFEELGITYNQMEGESLNGKGAYTWYEYLPKELETAEKGSLPLIITLHGFGNDPRLQGDTTGWVEVAAKHGAVVVSPEWQEKDVNFAKVDGLGEEGVMELVAYLKDTYPQIDSSRVYITGLSAGGSKTALWLAKHPDIFVAGASVSAPGIDKAELAEVAENYTAGKAPYLYIVGDHDYFQMVPVDGSSPYGMPNIFFDDPNVSMFKFIQAYQKINGFEVSDKPDLTKNEYFGVQLDNQEWIEIGSKEALVGSLKLDGTELIRLVAIKDLAHWNYRPEAEYIWDFFMQYQR